MDPFALLGVPRRFDLDLRALEKTHRELSRALHPDRFAQAGASERRESLERMASVNEAWRIVRDPIRRAEALLRLAGAAVDGSRSQDGPAPAFLMEMLEEREALAEAREANDLAKVARIGDTMKARASAVEAKMTTAFASPSEAPNATGLVPLLGEMRFYRRFLDEVLAIQEDAEERAST